MASFGKSRSAAKPARTFDWSTRASEHSRRRTSCSFDISSEKMATPVFASRAAYCAMLRANAVFPMLGPAGDDDEVGGLQAGGHAVEVDEARSARR